MTRILIVEDTEIFASGLRATLELDASNQIDRIVPSVALAEAVLRETAIDVVLADVRLEDGTAFDLLKRVAGFERRPGFLVVSSFDLAQYVEAALRMGASGYLLKTAPAEEILQAVRSVAAGGWAFDRELVRRTGDAKQLKLSEREREIIAGLLAGRSNDEIGADLGISRKTVESYISKLFLRFGFTSRVELVRLAEREQWLERAMSQEDR